MAEIHVLRDSGLLSCLGLGSCIGIVMLDPETGIAGMAHLMLPESFSKKPTDKPGKFVNTGIQELIGQLERAGADRHRLRVAYSGGAQVFKFGSEAGLKLDLGARNASAVKSLLDELGLDTVAIDVGGHTGRTMTFTVETGIVTVRTVTQGESVLCQLR
ncbi:MAG: chemotaxis protein CheD [Armatimonadetes bacterium]|nr:chemotaxis protein CheD [Armatimonadota bacterium]